MSNTSHHFKQRLTKCDLEYWSRRPGTQKAGAHPGRLAKTLTHRLERRWPSKAKELVSELGA